MKLYCPILWIIMMMPVVVLSGFADEPRTSSKITELRSLVMEVAGNASIKAFSGSGESRKCGLDIIFNLAERWHEMSETQKQRYFDYSQPLVTDANRVIGNFIIYYDTSGPGEPALLGPGGTPIPNSREAYIDSVGAVFNEVWNTEIKALGYRAPPLENGMMYYRIFVRELSSQGIYGRTQTTDPLGTSPFRSATFIEIDNDFRNYYSEGINGLKVTAAHEFHHAIQLGAYSIWNSDLYFYEITSTWMEDVLYTEVNDYYQYLFNTPRVFQASQFSEPELSFVASARGIEYSRAVWGKFIEKRFSPAVMLHAWEHMITQPSVASLNSALLKEGSSLRSALAEYAEWNLNAGPLCDTVVYYAEGKQYPRIRTRARIEYTVPQRSIADSIQSMGTAYYPIAIGNSLMMTTINNVLLFSADPVRFRHFTYDLNESGGEGFRKLANGIYVRLQVPDPQNWSVTENVPTLIENVIVYPSPFYPDVSGTLKFRLPGASGMSVSLDIFTMSLRHIFSGNVPVVSLKPLEPGVLWNGVMSDGADAPSGIYIYFLKDGNNEYKGKFSLIRN